MDFLLNFLLANKLYSLLLFTLGFISGFSFAKLLNNYKNPSVLIQDSPQPPAITTTQSQCDEPKTLMRLGYVTVEKIYHDGVIKDVNCRFKDANDICKESGKKCKFLP